MESLDGTGWDVLISGTGLQQSLLALALSRSNKKVVHIDRNGFYGGCEAALSLQEAQEWVDRHEETPSQHFRNAELSIQRSESSSSGQPALSFSRAYSLALAPQIIYSRSALLQALVSSKVYRQLDFQAVGNWYIYKPRVPAEGGTSLEASAGTDNTQNVTGTLLKVPNGREDIFSAESIDLRSKRSLMNFLRFVADFENQPEKWDPYRTKSLPDFLAEQYRIPHEFHGPLLALTLSPHSPKATTTEYALPRIAKHLRSIGVFGPGFGAVVPKWGGLAEIAQVACRAGAVGGAVYVLNRGARSISQATNDQDGDSDRLRVTLDDGSVVQTRWAVGADEDLPHVPDDGSHTSGLMDQSVTQLSRSISIVASSLSSLLPPVAENAPKPAAALVIVPAGCLTPTNTGEHAAENPPVHIVIHSSDTGECPDGQAILYASTSAPSGGGFAFLDDAIQRVLESVEEQQPRPEVLWSMRYEQRIAASNVRTNGVESAETGVNDRILRFPPVSLDLALDDAVVDSVRRVWREITDEESDGFMAFEDREGVGMEDNGDDP